MVSVRSCGLCVGRARLRMRLLPSSTGISAAVPRTPNSPSVITDAVIGSRVPASSPSTAAAVGPAMAWGPAGQSFPSDWEIERRRCAGTTSVTNRPPIVAAFQPTTNEGGRPATVTTAPLSPVSMCNSPATMCGSAAAAVPINRSLGMRPSRAAVSINRVCFGPAGVQCKQRNASGCASQAVGVHVRPSLDGNA